MAKHTKHKVQTQKIAITHGCLRCRQDLEVIAMMEAEKMKNSLKNAEPLECDNYKRG